MTRIEEVGWNNCGWGAWIIKRHLRILHRLAQILRCPKRAAVAHLGLNALVLALSLLTLGFAAKYVLDQGVPGDEAAVESLAEIRSTFFTDAFLEVGAMGGSVPAAMVVLVGVAVLWLRRERYLAGVLAGAMAGGMVLNFLLKLPFDRPRPAVMIGGEMVHTTAFPSGHSLVALIAYGGLAFFASLLVRDPRLRRAGWVAAATFILVIGFARIYLGTHYVTDILFAYIAGIIWMSTIVAASVALKPFSAADSVESCDRP